MRLEGKVAIVTGAGSGIGRASAMRLAREGAAVLCVDVMSAAATADEIRAAGGAVAEIEMDVRDPSAWADAVARAESTFGPVDCLANIAGVVSTGTDTVLEQTEEEWARILDVNLRGSWLGMRAVLPSMLTCEDGRIVNIASEAALIGMPGLAAYSATKGAIQALTRQAAIEYVKKGVTVNAIAPGYIRTPIQDGIDPDLLAEQAAALPPGYLGKPDDVAGSVAYLCSGDASYVTGQTLAIDGGWCVS